MDANSADSLAHLAEDIHGGGFAVEDAGVPVVARWWDVRRAAVAIARDKDLPAIARLLADGLPQHEIAQRLDVSRQSLGRGWRASLEELLAELNAVRRAA